MKTSSKFFIGVGLTVLVAVGAVTAVKERMPEIAEPPPVDDNGMIVAPSFQLPFSSYASDEAKKVFVNRLKSGGTGSGGMLTGIAERRATIDEVYFGPQLKIAAKLYPYTSEKTTIAGVPVEIIEPESGVAKHNENRVLINLHGGGFMVGGGIGGAVESVPVAGEGRIKVISVDYRMAPEHKYPAATEDVVAVFSELLKTYPAQNIGIYGCSAGGMLSGQTVAHLLHHDLPVPGAIGIFCASTYRMGQGDSGYIAPRYGSTLSMIPPLDPNEARDITPYFAGADTDDPLVYPSKSEELISRFPPTLLLTGTRAPELSGAVQSHLQFQLQGVDSQLILFDGLDHGFIGQAEFPESRQAYKLIYKFFDEHLGP